MPYSFFHEKFPEIAFKETRSFASFDRPELAGGEFGLLEMYCAQWFRKNDPNIIRELKGPGLNTMSPQSKLAPALLEVVIGLLEDQAYVNRLKRHYQIFRTQIEKEAGTFKKRPKRLPKRKPKKRRR